MRRYVCIHGHFYQPPREHAWLEAIARQDSAHPYHDWNERIAAECYGPNALCRVLDDKDRIVKLVNNYTQISFNFGPTLLSWLRAHAAETYRAILEADRGSREQFSGHGSAIAQVYNHIIMPLANRRDRQTQIIWGRRDFEYHFNRRPEGMWLAETAVDAATLDQLAEHGIRFTILSPHQASRIRPLNGNGDEWQDVIGGRIDPSRAYLCRLPSGRSIALFFYDGPISHAIAFNGVLGRGDRLAEKLLAGFHTERDWPQLVHVATDGETYGHHHKFGDMALAYALAWLPRNTDVTLTNYGEYLERHPPTYEVEILENTAWSCTHGLGRWSADCGCSTGRRGWNQAWRKPLRTALDMLRDRIGPLYERHADRLFSDPWAARDAYIDVILDRSAESWGHFLGRHAKCALSPEEQIVARKLLEMQRHALLMYTSCGWFFDDVSGIETVQILQYAGRALELAEEVFGVPMENEFLATLAEAKSNVPACRDGRHVYEKSVRSARVDLKRVAAHYGVRSLFEPYGPEAALYCFAAGGSVNDSVAVGQSRFVTGRVAVESAVTGESETFDYAAVYVGELHLAGGVRHESGDAATLFGELRQAFEAADFFRLTRTLEREFEVSSHSLHALFHDEQREILARLLAGATTSAELLFRQIYDQHLLKMRFLQALDAPLPPVFRKAAEVVVQAELERALADADVDAARVERWFAEADALHLALDRAGLSHILHETATRQMKCLRVEPSDNLRIKRLLGLIDMARRHHLDTSFWRVQNIFYDMARGAGPGLSVELRNLGEALGFRVG